MTSKIWGDWETEFFGSGTMIVRLRPFQNKHLEENAKPYLHVSADKAIHVDRERAAKSVMCKQIAAFLNGEGQKPIWLNDFDRISEHEAISLAGGRIAAVGPMTPITKHLADREEDQSEEAKDNRARLMDVLFLKGKK